jgi:hypothetical protein
MRSASPRNRANTLFTSRGAARAHAPLTMSAGADGGGGNNGKRRALVSGLRNEALEHLTLVIHGPPEVHHLVEVPTPMAEATHAAHPLAADVCGRGACQRRYPPSLTSRCIWSDSTRHTFAEQVVRRVGSVRQLGNEVQHGTAYPAAALAR